MACKTVLLIFYLQDSRQLHSHINRLLVMPPQLLQVLCHLGLSCIANDWERYPNRDNLKWTWGLERSTRGWDTEYQICIRSFTCCKPGHCAWYQRGDFRTDYLDRHMEVFKMSPPHACYIVLYLAPRAADTVISFPAEDIRSCLGSIKNQMLHITCTWLYIDSNVIYT